MHLGSAFDYFCKLSIKLSLLFLIMSSINSIKLSEYVKVSCLPIMCL
nr:MAG TPA: hypothetical protein [Caudoviricetes sp.]